MERRPAVIDPSRFVLWKLWMGVLLLCLALSLPGLGNLEQYLVLDVLEAGVRSDNQITIMTVPFRLALLNSIFRFPQYVGAFYVAAALIPNYRRPKHVVCSLCIVTVLVLLVAHINNHNFGVYYNETVVGVSLLLLQLLHWQVDHPFVASFHKVAVLLLFLTSMQFLELMPAMSNLMGMGRGEAAQLVRGLSVVYGLYETLNFAMLSSASICIALGGIVMLLIRNKNRMMQIEELKRENTQMLMDARLQEMQNRSIWELKHLVHDLKTPLTSIQTLAFVVKLHCGGEEFAETREYLELIEGSVEHMSGMISEILYEQHRVSTTVAALMNTVLAQLSATGYADSVTHHIEDGDTQICVNSVRMARVIINLADNAHHAKGTRPLEIAVNAHVVEEDGQPRVAISVTDNGIGIPTDRLESIWRRGHSSKGSSGLGLPFVRETVENSGGTIRTRSTVGVGTEFTILLPIGDDKHE